MIKKINPNLNLKKEICNFNKSEKNQMIDFNLKLQSNKILLRPLQSEDFTEFQNLTKDESMWIYFTSDLSDKNQLKIWVETAIKDLENKTRLPFTIIDLEQNKIIGSTSFANISARDKRVEIGWTWIAKEYQGKGFNKEVKLLMLEYCFEENNFERVEFKTDVLNTAARKALLNIGMTEEGILRSHTLMTKQRRRDTIYYSVLKNEWLEIKKKNNWE